MIKPNYLKQTRRTLELVCKALTFFPLEIEKKALLNSIPPEHLDDVSGRLADIEEEAMRNIERARYALQALEHFVVTQPLCSYPTIRKEPNFTIEDLSSQKRNHPAYKDVIAILNTLTDEQAGAVVLYAQDAYYEGSEEGYERINLKAKRFTQNDSH